MPFQTTRVLLAAALFIGLSGCEKHQDPIGTVPSDDVPARPVEAPEAPPGPVDGPRSCEGLSGTDLDECRRQPDPGPRDPAPVEPTRSPPPESGG
ncbi:hypothetical protein [Luteimonas kalidii]|uniref:Lipoprotein n=1 Tax=Luteimonas kalidii TaxID=3042025 RepID=A0ABT6JY79_9GAMM|nr:hypothetical protein [Luteimonas kalidii]MDH5835655.1 hypothetical protein [Luteimonas kalidii]